MNHRNSLIAIFVVAISAAFLLLIATDLLLPRGSLSALSPSEAVDEQATKFAEPVETDARLATEREVAGLQASATDDGPALLTTYCAECHSVRLLEKSRTSRSAWEKTLSRMERYSGRMSDGERALVLEYLAGPDE